MGTLAAVPTGSATDPCCCGPCEGCPPLDVAIGVTSLAATATFNWQIFWPAPGNVLTGIISLVEEEYGASPCNTGFFSLDENWGGGNFTWDGVGSTLGGLASISMDVVRVEGVCKIRLTLLVRFTDIGWLSHEDWTCCDSKVWAVLILDPGDVVGTHTLTVTAFPTTITCYCWYEFGVRTYTITPPTTMPSVEITIS